MKKYIRKALEYPRLENLVATILVCFNLLIHNFASKIKKKPKDQLTNKQSFIHRFTTLS